MKLDGDTGVIRHFIRDCEVRPLSRDTIINYRHHLRMLVDLLQKLCEKSELELVTVFDLRICVQHLLGTPSDTVRGVYRKDGETLDISSVRGYVRVWKAFFSWCYKEELIHSNPADKRLSLPKPPKKVTPTFSDEQVEKMLACFDLHTEMGFRDYVMVLLLLDTGMRVSEIVSLRLDGFYDNYIKVMGKGRKEREIGLYPDVGKLVWKYINKYRKPATPDEPSLFLSCGRNRKGAALTVAGIAAVIKRVKVATGIHLDGTVRLSPHTFRHTFAKMYMQQGGEVLSLSREMGHSSVDITENYLKDFGSTEARQQHSSFSPVGRLNLKNRQKKNNKTQVGKKSR